MKRLRLPLTQVKQCFQAMEETLVEAGMHTTDLVQLTVFLTRADAEGKWHAAAAAALGPELPTMHTVFVQALSTEGAAVELSGYAAA